MQHVTPDKERLADGEIEARNGPGGEEKKDMKNLTPAAVAWPDVGGRQPRRRSGAGQQASAGPPGGSGPRRPVRMRGFRFRTSCP